MTTITHRIDIDASISEVYEVIATLGGLRSWWTTDIHGNPERNGELVLGFGDDQKLTLKVIETKKNKWLIWDVTKSNFPAGNEWIGTKISFRFLEGTNRDTAVIFEHAGWNADTQSKTASEFQWGLSLDSLKKLSETGKGDPETPKRTPTKKASGWFPVT